MDVMWHDTRKGSMRYGLECHGVAEAREAW